MDSFIAWIGGKRLLRKEICARFPEGGYTKYVEVFGGAGWVLFHKEKHAEEEVYNDINGNLVNLFKCVKHHPAALEEEMALMLNSREVFENYKELYRSRAMTDIQRAAMYFYMIRTSYGAKVKSFGGKNRDVTKAEYLKPIQERLKTVVVENRDFETLIKQYDRPHTLFYCDPPYLGAERFYDAPFDEKHHMKLAYMLHNIKGKCVVSYNDNEFIRELYKDMDITEVSRQNNLSYGEAGNKRYSELIIRNYK